MVTKKSNTKTSKKSDTINIAIANTGKARKKEPSEKSPHMAARTHTVAMTQNSGRSSSSRKDSPEHRHYLSVMRAIFLFIAFVVVLSVMTYFLAPILAHHPITQSGHPAEHPSQTSTQSTTRDNSYTIPYQIDPE